MQECHCWDKKAEHACCSWRGVKNTILFIEKLAPGVRVIIPHLGGLNGGYTAIKNYGLWDNPDVYTDTALASSFEISDYIETYGHERIMFGSDFPFGDPESELNKIYRLNINNNIRKAVLCDNITSLLADSKCLIPGRIHAATFHECNFQNMFWSCLPMKFRLISRVIFLHFLLQSELPCCVY